MIIVTAWLLIDQLQTGHRSRFRIDHWRRVDALIAKIGGSGRATYLRTPSNCPRRKSSSTIPTPPARTTNGAARWSPNTSPKSGDTIPILAIANPDELTDPRHPPALAEELIAPVMMMPLRSSSPLWPSAARRILRLALRGPSQRDRRQQFHPPSPPAR